MAGADTSWMDAMPAAQPTPAMMLSGSVPAPSSTSTGAAKGPATATAQTMVEPHPSLDGAAPSASWMDAIPAAKPTPAMQLRAQAAAGPSPNGGMAKNIGAGLTDISANLINIASDPYANIIAKPLLTIGVGLHDWLAPKFGGQRFTNEQRADLLDDEVPQPGQRLMTGIAGAIGSVDPADVTADTGVQRVVRKGIGNAGLAVALAPAAAGVALPAALGAGGAITGDVAAQAAPDWAKPMAELAGNVGGAVATHGIVQGGKIVLSKGATKLGNLGVAAPQWMGGPGKQDFNGIPATNSQLNTVANTVNTALGPDGALKLQVSGQIEARARALEAQLADPNITDADRIAATRELNTLAPQREQLVPGLNPTVAQIAPTLGAVAYERDMRTTHNEDFANRDRQNNAAMTGAIQDMAPGPQTPDAVAALFMRQLDDIQTRNAEKLGAAKGDVAGQIANLGDEESPRALGQDFRGTLQAAKKPVHKETQDLWSQVDKEGKWALSAAPLRTAANEIDAEMSPSAKVDEQERDLIDRAKAIDPVVKFAELSQIREDINSAMRRLSGQNGMDTNVRRLTILKRGVDQSIEDAVTHIAGTDSGVTDRITAAARGENGPVSGGGSREVAGGRAGAGAAALPGESGIGADGEGGHGSPGGAGGVALGATDEVGRGGKPQNKGTPPVSPDATKTPISAETALSDKASGKPEGTAGADALNANEQGNSVVVTQPAPIGPRAEPRLPPMLGQQTSPGVQNLPIQVRRYSLPQPLVAPASPPAPRVQSRLPTTSTPVRGQEPKDWVTHIPDVAPSTDEASIRNARQWQATLLSLPEGTLIRGTRPASGAAADQKNPLFRISGDRESRTLRVEVQDSDGLWILHWNAHRNIGALKDLMGGEIVGNVFDKAGRGGLAETLPSVAEDRGVNLDSLAEQGGLGAGRRLPVPPQSGPDLFGGQRAAPAPRAPEPTIRTDPAQSAFPGTEPSGPPRTARWPNGGGSNFTDLTNESPPHSHDAARDWVLDLGAATGHEHIAVVDNQTGEVVHAGTNGHAAKLGFDAENARDQVDAFTLHHNHPNSTALSEQDVTMLANPGISHVVAHGHDGTTTHASLGPKLASQRSSDPVVSEKNASALRSTYLTAMRLATRVILPLIDSGKITHEEASQSINEVANRILHAQGDINYSSNRSLPESVSENLAIKLKELGHADDRHTVSLGASEGNKGLPEPLHDGTGQGLSGSESSGGVGQEFPVSAKRPSSSDQGGLREDKRGQRGEGDEGQRPEITPLTGSNRAPESLHDFIISKGGVRDESGEFAAQDLDKIHHRGGGRLINPNGLTHDQAREAAAEAGFLRPNEDVNDFRDKMTSHNPVYRPEDEFEASQRKNSTSAIQADADRRYDATDRVNVAAENMGVDLRPDEREHATLLHMGGMDPRDAVRNAVTAGDHDILQRNAEINAIGYPGVPLAAKQSELGGTRPPQLIPNITKEDANTYTSAVAATKAEKERFGQGGVGQILRPGRFGAEFHIGEGDVPTKIFTRRPSEPEEVERFINAVGGAEKAADLGQRTLVSELYERKIIRPDGTIDTGKFTRWQRQRAATIDQFPGLGDKFRDAQAAQITLDQTIARHAEALRDFQNGAAKNFLNGTDPQNAVGKVFTSGNSTAGARALYDAVKHDPDALAGLKRGAVDFLDRKFNVDANPEETGDAIKGKQFLDFMASHRNAFKIWFGGQGAQNIEMVEAAINRIRRAQQKEATIGSNTAQKLRGLSQHGQSPVSGHGSQATTLLGIIGLGIGEMAHGHLGGMALGVGLPVASHYLNALRQSGVRTMNDLGREAMLHPDLARALLQRVDAQKQMPLIAQRKVAAALHGAVMADIAGQQSKEQNRVAP